MLFEAKEVTPETLLGEVQQLANKKYRFVTMSQTVVDENTLRLFYHFDENLTMTDLRNNADSACGNRRTPRAWSICAWT